MPRRFAAWRQVSCLARRSVTAGLADSVASFEDVLGEFAAALQSRRRLTANGRAPLLVPMSLPAVAFTIPPRRRRHARKHHAPASRYDSSESNRPPSPAAAAAPSAAVHRADAQAIAEICLIAGCPERTAEFLASAPRKRRYAGHSSTPAQLSRRSAPTSRRCRHHPATRSESRCRRRQKTQRKGVTHACLREANNLGDVLKYEAPNLYSRDRVTVASGQTLASIVVGVVTATAR